jgi:hyperosmotically inducible periplasmic protein
LIPEPSAARVSFRKSVAIFLGYVAFRHRQCEEIMIKLACKTLLATALVSGLALWAQTTGQDTQTTAPDNTKMNQDERNSGKTADQQKENQSDRELARQTRRAIVQDKSLSTYAHNVKIVAQGGTVTLKGPVKSEEEKAAIEKKAAEVAGGPAKVQNELQVAGENGSKPSPSQQ